MVIWLSAPAPIPELLSSPEPEPELPNDPDEAEDDTSASSVVTAGGSGCASFFSGKSVACSSTDLG